MYVKSIVVEEWWSCGVEREELARFFDRRGEERKGIEPRGRIREEEDDEEQEEEDDDDNEERGEEDGKKRRRRTVARAFSLTLRVGPISGVDASHH